MIPLPVEVVVALITAVQGILIALLARQSSRVKQIAADARAAREQVQNSHTVNLRDDFDGKHGETSAKLDQILAAQNEHGGAIVGIRQDLRQLRDVDHANNRDIRDLDRKVEEHLTWSRGQADIIQQLRAKETS